MIHPGRHGAVLEDDFVLFLIGARFHRPWRVWRWLPVVRAMTAMQVEMAAHPEIGCLHVENFGGLRPVSVQYWASFGHLERYARSPEWSHLEAWRDFNRLVGSDGEVGIWHETYQVRSGEYEAMYGNMPVVGLAAAGALVPLDRSSTAARRIGARADDAAPVEGY